MGSKQAKLVKATDAAKNSKSDVVNIKQEAQTQLANLVHVRKVVPPLKPVEPLQIRTDASPLNPRPLSHSQSPGEQRHLQRIQSPAAAQQVRVIRLVINKQVTAGSKYQYMVVDAQGNEIPAQIIFQQEEEKEKPLKSLSRIDLMNRGRVSSATDFKRQESLSESRPDLYCDSEVECRQEGSGQGPVLSQSMKSPATFQRLRQIFARISSSSQNDLNKEAEDQIIDEYCHEFEEGQRNSQARVKSADKVKERQALEELRAAVRKNPRRFQEFMDKIEKQSEQTEELEQDQSLHNSESGQVKIQTETKINQLSPLESRHNTAQSKQSLQKGLKQISYRSEVNLGFNHRQTSLIRSQTSKRAPQSSEAVSTVCVNLKSVLSNKMSGTTLKQSDCQDSKGHMVDCNNLKFLLQKNSPEMDDMQIAVSQIDMVASASPSMRRGPLLPPRMMNTSAKKLAQIPRQSRQGAALSKHSNRSEDTPAFKHSLTKTNILLERQNQKEAIEAPESPAFVIVTDSSGHNQLRSMSSSQRQSANQRAQRVDHLSRVESMNNSSHFRITPGCVLTGSGSYKSGTQEEPKSSNAKFSSQQTFGAKKFNQRLAGESETGENNVSQGGRQNLRCKFQKHETNDGLRQDNDFSLMLMVNKNQQSTDWNPSATSPQRKSVDDTMRNIKKNTQKNIVASPDVQSFSNLISNQGLKIYIKKDENLLMNSEKSSSLVTSYNSDAGGDQLRVREFKKTDNSTKRSRTSPSSFYNRTYNLKLSPTRVREALIKMNQHDDESGLDLKRMKSSQNERMIINPIAADCNNASKEINSVRASGSKRNSLKVGAQALKSTLGRKSSLLSPVQVASDKTVGVIEPGRISKQSQSKSRSNSRSSNIRGANMEDQASNNQMSAAQPVSPLTPNLQFLLNPKAQNPDFETIRNKSNSAKSDIKSGELEPENLTDAIRQLQENPAQPNNDSQTEELNVPSASSNLDSQTNKSPNEIDCKEQTGNPMINQIDFDAFGDHAKYFPYEPRNLNEIDDDEYFQQNKVSDKLDRIIMSSSQSNIKRRATGSQLLASVPENDEENKAEEHSSLSHSTYELRQTQARQNSSRKTKMRKMRAQKSLIMQSKDKKNSFIDNLPNLPPLRQQLTTGMSGFADQVSNSTLNDKDYPIVNIRSKNSITGAHFTQQVLPNQKRYNRRQRRQMATSQDLKNKKMRLMTSPQGSFVIPGRQYNQETLTDQRRSQSSSRKSRDHHRVSQEELQNQKQRQKNINDALFQIDSIFSSLMTPVNRMLNCGGGSKCSGQSCSVHHGYKTPQSEKNNFTAYMESKAKVPQPQELEVNIVQAKKQKSSQLNVVNNIASDQAIHSEEVVITESQVDMIQDATDLNKLAPPAACSGHPGQAKENNSGSEQKSEDISEEMPDQQRIQNFTSQMHQYQSHLMPELTCKTIRELSIEDALSSMGNLSANISPQITSIRNTSGGAYGSIFGGSRKERRRKSQLYGARKGFVRQHSVQFRVSPTQSPNSSSQHFKRQMTYNSEALRKEENILDQKRCETLNRKKFAHNKTKITSNFTCTECGMSQEDSPRSSQDQEVHLTVHDSDQKPQKLLYAGYRSRDPSCSNQGQEQFIFVCSSSHNRRSNTSKQLENNLTCEHLEISKGHTQTFPKDDIVGVPKKLVKVNDFQTSSVVGQAPKTVQFEESPPTLISQTDQSFQTTLSPNMKFNIMSPKSAVKQESRTETRPSEAQPSSNVEPQPNLIRLKQKQFESDVTNSTSGFLTVKSGRHQDSTRKVTKSGSINDVDMLQQEAIYFKMTKTNSQSKGTQSVADTANFLGLGQGTPKSINSKNALGSIRQDSVTSPPQEHSFDRRALGFPAPVILTKSNSMQPRVLNKANILTVNSMTKHITDPKQSQQDHQSVSPSAKEAPTVILHSTSGNTAELQADAGLRQVVEERPSKQLRSKQNRGGILRQLKKEKKLKEVQRESAATSAEKSPPPPKPVLTIQKQNIKFEEVSKAEGILKKQKSILKNSSLTILASVEEVTDGNQTTNEKDYHIERKESENVLLSFQQVQQDVGLVPPGMIKMRSETPAAASSNQMALENNPRSSSTALKKLQKSLRLIKNVGKVYRSVSVTPQNTSSTAGPKYQEFFDLARKTKILTDLRGKKLVDESFALQLELENKRKYDEARLKVEIDARQSSNPLRQQQYVSPDYHNARENSTPSAYKSSVKLQFGNNMAFQDFSIVDNFDMTPSNFNHDRVSHSSMHTYGGSSAAFYTSEMMFNPELYDVEAVVDSNDQSPMGKSMLSEYQFKVSSRGGTQKDFFVKGNNNSCSISDLDIQKAHNIQVDIANANLQKMRFQSINQQSAGSSQNREQTNVPPYIMITDVRTKPKEHHSQTIIDPKNNSQLGQHLLRPDWNNKKAMDQISNTTLSRSDLNFPLISRRHSSSEDSSRMTSIITYENKGQVRSSNVSNLEAYKTAEVNQRTLEDLDTKHAEHLMKTAEKKKPGNKIDIMLVKPKVSVDQEFSKQATESVRKPFADQLMPKAQDETQSRRPVSMQIKSSPKKPQAPDYQLQKRKHRLHPALIRQITEEEAQNLQVTVDKTYNMLHLPENKLLNMQTTTRSCATGRKKQMADLSSRVKTDGNVSQYAKESISDNLMWQSQSQNQNVSSDDQQSFSQSTINANQRFNKFREKQAIINQFSHGAQITSKDSLRYRDGVLTQKNATRRKYLPHTSTPTNLNSKRRIVPEREEISRQQSSEVKSNISRIRHTSITTTSCVSTKVCGKERINQYQVMQKIGTGSFSEVFLCFDVQTNKIYAMKVMNKSRLRRKTITKTANAFDNVKTEMAIMKKLDHPYILKLFEIIDDPNQHKLYLIIEYSKHGSVEKKIEKLVKHERKKRKGISADDPQATKPQGLPEDTIRLYFSQLILALEYCHEKLGIIHRDIKPDNLLIHDNGNIKLSDFGVSELLPEDGNDKVRSNAGSAYFFSPEACIGKQYRGRLNDIWACGITLFYMATGKYPFASGEYSKLYRLIQNTEPEYPAEMLGTPLHDLICRLLKKLPDDRIRINEIKNHPWITKNGTEPLQDVDMEDYTAPTEAELKHTYTKCIKREKFIYHRKVQDAASAFN